MEELERRVVEMLSEAACWRRAEGFLHSNPMPCPTCPRMTGAYVGVGLIEIWCIPCGWAHHDYRPPPFVHTGADKMVKYGCSVFIEAKQLLESKHRLDG